MRAFVVIGSPSEGKVKVVEVPAFKDAGFNRKPEFGASVLRAPKSEEKAVAA